MEASTMPDDDARMVNLDEVPKRVFVKPQLDRTNDSKRSATRPTDEHDVYELSVEPMMQPKLEATSFTEDSYCA